MKNLNEFVCGSVPTLVYFPDFITDVEQDQLLNNIYQAPASRWKSLKNRRLQNWGGVVHEKGLLAQDLPPWLTRITLKVFEESGLFPSAINHVLINEYLPNQGIMPHQDGSAYHPVVAILSLGSPVVMDFTPHSRFDSDAENSRHPFSVIMMPRSLLIFEDEAYTDYLHGIKDSEVHHFDGAVNIAEASKYYGVNKTLSRLEEAVGVQSHENFNNICRHTNRISLTCRLVPKVHKNLFKF